VQRHEDAGAPGEELLADGGVDRGIVEAGPLVDVDGGGMLLQPEHERMSGGAVMKVVVRDKASSWRKK